MDKQTGKLLQLGEIQGKTFVCGDIHGCYDDLMSLLDDASFDFAIDRLVCTGDLIDRGPDSLMCARLPEEDWFYTVMGNHEAIALECIDDDGTHKAAWWHGNGGAWYYSTNDTLVKDVIKNNFYELPLGIELTVNGKVVAIIHADPLYDDWGKTKEMLSECSHDEFSSNPIHQTAMWSRDRINEELIINGCDLMIHGHSIMKAPRMTGNRLFLDTGSFLKYFDGQDGGITLLCLDDELQTVATGE